MIKTTIIALFLLLSLGSMAQKATTASYTDNNSSLSLRTNIPTWLLAIPSLGIEYRTGRHMCLMVDGAFSHWNFKRKGKDHFWRSWNVAPQLRYYVGHERSTYFGLQYSMGEYNLSSQQAKFLGGGLSIGKQYAAGRKLLIDLGLTLGYLHIEERESFLQVGQTHYRRRAPDTRNYWGPTHLSIRLSRKLH